MSTRSIAATLPLGIRDWVGPEGDPTPPLAGKAHGEPYVGCFCLQSVSPQRTKTDKPYLRLKLTHAGGTVEAKVWDDAERIAAGLVEDGYVGVRGRVEIYQGASQIIVESIEHLRVEPHELELFMRRSLRAPAEMEAELEALVKSVADLPLRTLLRRVLGRNSPTGERFRHAPAAKMHHHAYVGGLLEHTLSVARMCDLAARHYGAAIDRDLLVAGALLHDIGKIEEIATRPGFPYSDEGKLLGHILLGLQIVRDAAQKVPELAPERLLHLQHLIASHQGRYEWQSPREPRLLEALLLHHLDDLDAKLHQAEALVSAVESGWSTYDRTFARDFLRHRAAGADADGDGPPLSFALDLFPAP